MEPTSGPSLIGTLQTSPSLREDEGQDGGAEGLSLRQWSDVLGRAAVSAETCLAPDGGAAQSKEGVGKAAGSAVTLPGKWACAGLGPGPAGWQRKAG